MSASCHHQSNFDGTSPRYKKVLLIVIAINASMFMIEMWFGVSGNSQSLKADALDFLGDSATYALSLWVIGKSVELRSTAALIKGVSLLLMAAWVLISTISYVVNSNDPSAPTMAWVGLLALGANLLSVLLLLRYRDGDANVRSVWLCSRNDAIGNLAVILAAIAVYITQTHWPDLLVALILASLFSYSALQIFRQSLHELKHDH